MSKHNFCFGMVILLVQMVLFSPPVLADLGAVPDKTIASAFGNWDLGVRGLPDVRRPEENWPAAKLKAAQPDWVKWLAGNRSKVDQWMTSSPEDPTKPVGWAHDYINPATGAFLQWTPNTVAPGAGASDKLRAAWGLHVREYNIARMLDAVRLYRLSGDVRYRDWVVSQMDLYAANYSTLPLQTWWGQSHLFLSALDEAIYSFQLIEISRLMRDSVPKATLTGWQNGLFDPMLANLMASSKDEHNIAVWIAAAVAAIGFEFENPTAKTFGLNSPRGLVALLNRGVSNDYFWYEMSLHYQDYVVSALTNFLYAARIRGAEDAATLRVGAIARGLMVSPLAIRFAKTDRPMLNDSVGFRKTPDRNLWSSVWRVLPTRIGIDPAVTEKSWGNLLDSPPALSDDLTLPAVVSQRVDGLDAVQLAADQWQALIRYGQRAIGHAQQEALTYDLQYKGVWLFQDLGTVSYGSPLHTEYFKRAPAQNVPLINREGQLPWPSEGEVVAFDPVTATTEVLHRRYQKGHSVSRKIQAQINGFSDQVTFSLDPKTPLPVGLVFNTRCQVVPVSGLAAMPSNTLDLTGPFSYWTDRREYSAGQSVHIELSCAGTRFAMTLSGSELKTLFVAKTPDSAIGVARTGLYIETKPVTNSVIKVRIEPL
jgi:hypothetical protein